VGIQSGEYTHYPEQYQIDIIRGLFEAAGIDTRSYFIFGY